jgi:hypothetical protein
MFWGDRERVHSLGCQKVRPGSVQCVAKEGGVDLLFALEGGTVEEDRERNREIVVTVDRCPNSTFTVNGVKSMIFEVGDELLVDERTKMRFTVVEGEGKFLGHRMPGNRPSQVGISESNSFEAYDWLMFLRTVNRTMPCKISLSIEKIC